MYQDFLNDALRDAQAREHEAMTALFREYPDLAYEASANAIVAEVRASGKPFTLDTLKEVVAALVADGRISLKSEAQVEADRVQAAEQAEQDRKIEKGRLIAEIAGRLKEGGHTSVAIEGEIKARFVHMNNQELATYLANIDRKKELRAMSVKDLRALVKKENPREPAQLPAELTRERLNEISRTDIGEFKRLVRLYGDQVNQRLGVVRQPMPGVAFGV
jgi:hypothetical protein